MAEQKKSCANCAHKYDIKKLDYLPSGPCKHSTPEGFVCMGFADEGIANWMTGLNAAGDICEMYRPKQEEKADPVEPGL